MKEDFDFVYDYYYYYYFGPMRKARSISERNIFFPFIGLHMYRIPFNKMPAKPIFFFFVRLLMKKIWEENGNRGDEGKSHEIIKVHKHVRNPSFCHFYPCVKSHKKKKKKIIHTTHMKRSRKKLSNRIDDMKIGWKRAKNPS